MISVLHLSDIHMGSGFAHGCLNPETGMNTRLEDFVATLGRCVDRAIASPAIAPAMGLRNRPALCSSRCTQNCLENTNSTSDQLTRAPTTTVGGSRDKKGTSAHRSADIKPISNRGKAIWNPAAAEIDKTANSSVISTRIPS